MRYGNGVDLMIIFLRYGLFFFLLCFPLKFYAAPQNGNVVSGSATIASVNNITTINQVSDRAIINWQNFNINAGEITEFVQPNKDAIALNRVISNSPSNIMGKLTANSNIWIINKKGILFGANAEVNVGGLLVSTADINDSDFINNNFKFVSTVNSNYSIINRGTIKIADNGLAVLVAPGIENSGIIEANLGKVTLASGSAFTLDVYGDNLIQYAVNSKITTPIYDLDDNVMHDAVKNTGTITANGGKVLLTANVVKDVVDNVINTSGIIEANTIGNKNGQIILHGATEGKVLVDGRLSAHGEKTGESGGFIETSGAKLDIKSTVMVDAGSKDAVAGNWLIDPTDMLVTDIEAGIYNGVLNGGTDLTITTNSAGGDLGNITFANTIPIAWSTNANFTVNAINNIIFNAGATIDRSGGGAGILTLRTDYDASSAGTFSFSGVNLIVSASGTNNLFYNPTSKTYATPNDYSANITGTNWIAYMLVNDVGVASGGTTGLQAMNLNLNASYALGKDIDASNTSVWNGGAGFNPIGNSTTPFAGRLEGNYYTIDGLYINRGTSTGIGLFGWISGASFIRNLMLTNPIVIGHTYVGSLIGRADSIGMLNNIAISQANIYGIDAVGGLVGIFAVSDFSVVSNVFVSGLLATSDPSISAAKLGGLAGSMLASGNIFNSYSAVRIYGGNTTTSVGGLVGDNAGGNITNSYSIGYVNTNFGAGSGLVGTNSGSITNSYFDTNTSGCSGGQSTSQLMQQENFASWDFANTWGIIEGISYPYLKWYYPTSPTVISGTASGANGKLVQVALNGSNLQSVYTGANGSYYQLRSSELLNNKAVLVYLDDATSKGNVVYLADSSGTSVTDLDINLNSVIGRAYTGGIINNTDLVTAKGALNSNNILYTNSGNDLITSAGTGFTTWPGTIYNIKGNINTNTAGQSYNGPVILGADAILTSIGGAITLQSTVNSDVMAHSLTINTTGDTTFEGLVGIINPLASLITNAGGTTYINGDGVRTIGVQTYGNDVVLGADTLLIGSTIIFTGKVNSDTIARTLTMVTMSNTVYFENFIGGITPLDSIVVDVAGTININGGGVTTIGSQTYNANILLGADAVLTGSTFLFTTIDAADHALTLDFSNTTEVDGAKFTNLQALITQGAGTVQLKNSIGTTGTQTYNNTNIELVSDVVLISSDAGTIDLQGDVNSDLTMRSLTINTASDIIFGGLVGNIHALSSLMPNASGAVHMDGGTITANYQTYNNPVILDVDTNLNGVNIVFNSTINGQYNLIVTDSGLVTFLKEVGGIMPLYNLTVNGAVDINSTLINTIDSQIYNGPVTLTTDINLSGNSIMFNGTVDGPYRLTIESDGGDIVFNQNVGVSTRLDGLIIINPNNVTNNAAMYVGYYIQNTGTGTTDLGSLFDATGPIFIITERVFGHINAGLLTLGSVTADMTGSVAQYVAKDAAQRVLTMHKIAQGQYFFNGYDLFSVGSDDVASSQVFVDVLPTYITAMNIPLPLYQKIFCDMLGRFDPMSLNLIKQLGSSYDE